MANTSENVFRYGADLYVITPSSFSADEFRVVALFTNTTITDGHRTAEDAKQTALADLDSLNQALARA